MYGSVVPVRARDPTKFQHQGFGMLLMEEAERIALEEHKSTKMAVISGQCYLKLIICVELCFALLRKKKLYHSEQLFLLFSYKYFLFCSNLSIHLKRIRVVYYTIN